LQSFLFNIRHLMKSIHLTCNFSYLALNGLVDEKNIPYINKPNTILAKFWCAESESVFRFFPARPQFILRKPKYTWFLWFESSFQNCLWNLFSTTGLSQIYKIRNVWKLPSPFSKNTLIPSSEKSSWSLKKSFWKKNCPKNSKMVMTIFQVQGFP
jgi:hypothetical protein